MSRITTESTSLFSVKSELSMTVMQEDKDSQFYCEVTYFVPGGTRMTETHRINITVYCESNKSFTGSINNVMFLCQSHTNTQEHRLWTYRNN